MCAILLFRFIGNLSNNIDTAPNNGVVKGPFLHDVVTDLNVWFQARSWRAAMAENGA